MKVTSNFDSKCFEGMDYLGNANVEIIKTFHTEENRMPTPSELHYAYLMRTRKSYNTCNVATWNFLIDDIDILNVIYEGNAVLLIIN